MGRPQVKLKEPTSEIVSWVLLAQKGDLHAREEIILITKNSFFKFCVYVTGNQEAANDLFQDAYVKAFSKINELHEPHRFHSWLCKIAKNLFLDSLKLKKNEETIQLDVISPTLFSTEADRESSIQIQRILNDLDYDSRMVLILVDMSEFSYAEAAEVLNTTEASVRSRLFRARKEFAAKYQSKK